MVFNVSLKVLQARTLVDFHGFMLNSVSTWRLSVKPFTNRLLMMNEFQAYIRLEGLKGRGSPALEAQRASLMQSSGLLSCDTNLVTYWWNTPIDVCVSQFNMNIKRCCSCSCNIQTQQFTLHLFGHCCMQHHGLCTTIVGHAASWCLWWGGHLSCAVSQHVWRHLPWWKLACYHATVLVHFFSINQYIKF